MNVNIRVAANIFDTIDPTKELTSLADKLQYGGTMLLLGMATVFAVLTVIWLSLVIFKLVSQRASEKEKAKPDIIPAPTTPAAEQSSSSEEIVAVIAAAIAMAESEGNGLKFRVVSFRKV